MTKFWTGALLALAMVCSGNAHAQQETGKLVVDVAPFTSERELPKKVDKQLRSGGLEWGVKDGLVVFTMVAKQFIDYPINHMTRYGRGCVKTPPPLA